MKVIFLDVDGVLNSRYTGGIDGIIGIDPDKCELLADIVRQTNAEIVLSSSWKTFWQKDGPCKHLGIYLNEELAKVGLSILEKTTDSGMSRGEGIRNWLNEHEGEIDAWVVLDDEVFPDFKEQGIMPCLVKCDFYDDGLTPYLADRAVEILMGRAIEDRELADNFEFDLER